MPTRISSLKGFNRVIIGRDIDQVFKNGHVYDVKKISNTIIITDLGEHADEPFLKGGTISQYITSGVPCLTKKEFWLEGQKKAH